MPQYRYQARVATGRTQSGVLSAQDAATAASMLRNQGHHVLQLAPAAGNKKDVGSLLKQLNYSSGPTQKDILVLSTCHWGIIAPSGWNVKLSVIMLQNKKRSSS